jgi:HSP20 family protein
MEGPMATIKVITVNPTSKRNEKSIHIWKEYAPQQLSKLPTWHPPMDIFETEGQLIVRIEAAGISEKDFSIEIENKYLRIEGRRQEMFNGCAFHLMEIPYGEFHIDVHLPVPIDHASATAEYKDGFLRIALSKLNIKDIPVTER